MTCHPLTMLIIDRSTNLSMRFPINLDIALDQCVGSHLFRQEFPYQETLQTATNFDRE